MTEKEFAQFHGFTPAEMEVLKPILQLFHCRPDCVVRICPDGADLAESGSKRAEMNANKAFPGWSESALEAIRAYCRFKGPIPFQAEDVRTWAANVPPAPSARAWGAIFVRAAKMKIIKAVGYAKVDNPLAHSTPATVWVAV